MQYHLFQLLINKPDCIYFSKLADCDVWVQESRVPVCKPDIWTGLGLEEWSSRASNDCINYLGNRILCIFRQPLIYLCFSYSFLDTVRKHNVEILDSPSWKTYWKRKACPYNGTKLNKGMSFLVHDSVMCKYRVVWREKLLVKCWESTMCVRNKMMFLTPQWQSTNPQILKLKFPVHTSSPKKKFK
jgi:hypothetical protein